MSEVVNRRFPGWTGLNKIVKILTLGRLRKKAAGKAHEFRGVRAYFFVRRSDEG